MAPKASMGRPARAASPPPLAAKQSSAGTLGNICLSCGKDHLPDSLHYCHECGYPRIREVRWFIAKLCMGARMTVQTNRIILGPMMPFIVADLGFDKVETGHIMSAFATGYAFTQIPGGNVADRIGSRLPLTLALLAVSIGSVLAPLVTDAFGKQGLWMTYFLMGLLEGPSYPSIGAMLGKWFPTEEKATANSLTGTGGSIGGLVAIGIGPILAERIGWRLTLVLIGTVSMHFSLYWFTKSSDKPITCSKVSADELKFLKERGVKGAMPETIQDVNGEKTFPWRLFTFPEVWAVCYAHAVFNFGRYFVYAWIPMFYFNELGMSATSAGICMMCLQVADAMIEFTAGLQADAWICDLDERSVPGDKRSDSVLYVRRVFSCVGFIGFGSSMLLCCLTRDVVAFTASLAIGKACASLHTAGFKTNYLDLTSSDTGTLVGVGNTMATVASMLAPVIAGYVIEHYTWNYMFVLVFCVNLSGFLVFGYFSSSSSLDEADPDKKVK